MRPTNEQRIDSINVFNDNKFNEVKNKYFVVSNALKSLSIKISGNLRKIIYKYNKSDRVMSNI